MTSASADFGLLRSLGRHLGVRLVVAVPIGHRARHLLLNRDEVGHSPEVAADVRQLEAVGRHWLATVAADDDSQGLRTLELPDATVALAPTHAEADGLSGVLVAVKNPGLTWNDSERDLLRFTTAYFREQVQQWTRRPLPDRPVQPGAPEARAKTPTAPSSVPGTR